MPNSAQAHLPKKVFILGLDGVTWKILRPWMEAGLLPNLSRLVDQGADATLLSTVPPISASAWVSFATGMNPGKHGMVDFVHPAPGGYNISLARSTERGAKALWNLVSEAGKKVGIIGVPVTFPPEAVNGFLITDFLTPGPESQFTYPPALKEELEQALGGFQLMPDERYRSTQHLDRFIADMIQDVERRKEATLYLMKNKPWDLFCVVFWSPDMVQHEVWWLLDPTHPRHNPALNQKLEGRIQGFYQALDQAAGEIVSQLDKDTAVVVMSDHGFGAAHKFFIVNSWLWREGYIRFKRTFATRLKVALFRLGVTPLLSFRLARRLGLGFLRRRFRFQGGAGLIKRLFLSFNDVDWKRTKAFAVGSFGQIYLNRQGLRPQGTLSSGEAEKLREEIAAKAKALRDAEDGTAIVEEVYRKEDLYRGPRSEQLPDLVLKTRDYRYMAFGHTDFGSQRLVEPIVGLSGHHRPEGICVLWGPGIRSGTLAPVRILDIAPTVLYLLGLPIPEDVDGRVLEEAIDPSLLAHYPQKKGPPAVKPTAADSGYTDSEQAELRERLRGFGYVA